MNILDLLGRQSNLFNEDIKLHDEFMTDLISTSTFLIIGGAGSIGKAVTKEIFKKNPKKIHIVDISENNIVELVRDIRSSLGYIEGDFQTFAIDIGGLEFEILMKNQNYDYIFNFSALKHVRSEKDVYTLLRMIETNIFNTIKSVNLAKNNKLKRYFCVSTDKAANPVSMMGASKKIMEMFLMKESLNIEISSARFANVAFSDGSLLYSINKRFELGQPIAAPIDIKRYFITHEESAQLCLFSCLLGANRDIFFPKIKKDFQLISISEIVENFILQKGYTPFICSSENEARQRSKELIKKKLWPCIFFKTDTTGEKPFEEFYTNAEELNLERFKSIGIIKKQLNFDHDKLDFFSKAISEIRKKQNIVKKDIVLIFNQTLDNFKHIEENKNLDQKM